VPEKGEKVENGHARGFSRARKRGKSRKRSRKRVLACPKKGKKQKTVTQEGSRMPEKGEKVENGHARGFSRARKRGKSRKRSRKRVLACPKKVKKQKTVTQEGSRVPVNPKKRKPTLEKFSQMGNQFTWDKRSPKNFHEHVNTPQLVVYVYAKSSH
jgi:hypothetical protein